MPIDVDIAVSSPPTINQITWTERDVLLYHLSLGAGRHAAADPELNRTFERDLEVIPTFALVAGQGISAGIRRAAGMSMPGVDVDLRRLLHAGQRLDVHRPIPVNGKAEIHTRVADVWDKGSAAVVVLEHKAFEDDSLLWTSSMQIWAKGDGGFGGHRGPDERSANPDRAADITVDSTTHEGQALLYRLNGDMNPLHIDPEFARTAGVGRPILHGLASLGIVAKAIIDHTLEGQAQRLTTIAARFAGVLRPGETIRTQMWCDGNDLSLRATCAERSDDPVLTRAYAVIDGNPDPAS